MNSFEQKSNKFDIVLTVHGDKLCTRTNEMHFLNFIFDNILYMFRIGKLFIIRKYSYIQRLVCIMHSYRLAALKVKMELVYGYIVVVLLMNSLTIRNM